jgi:N-acetyl-anhydromuramyl-L-alanine amidase AmpD
LRTIQIRPAALGNYNSGRKRRIDMLVLHVMQGGFGATGAWFAMPDARVSAHYGVSVDGDVACYVRDSDTAWHAGNPGYNARSIGIELEGHVDDPAAFTAPMLDALGELADGLCSQWNIARDRQHVIGHCEVPDPRGHGFGGLGHHTDPGPHFPWEKFMDGLTRRLA